MAYRALFFALYLTHSILSPIVNIFLPLKKEIVQVTDLSKLDSLDKKSYYPILDFSVLVQRHGYIAEEHVVKTKDEYILKLHRISGNSANPKSQGKPVAYLQHGLLQSSDSFVMIGPENDLAFQLVNAGYDVWLGNARGNTYSRKHASKSPKNENFWDFSFHEIALYDLPAMIDRVLEVTKAEKLTYYGFSMGTTLSYIMLSSLPHYNDKINLVYSLAPVAFWNKDFRKAVKRLDKTAKMIEEFTNYFKIYEVMPQSAIGASMGAKYCNEPNFILQPICSVIFCTVFPADKGKFNKTALPTLLAHNPAGTSRRVLLHYNQNIKEGMLRPYDYGEAKNLKKYGLKQPPIYNLTNIQAPVILWYGRGDDLVNFEDVGELEKKLPNVQSSNAVAYEKFNHIDFLWAPDAKKLVYDHIIQEK